MLRLGHAGALAEQPGVDGQDGVVAIGEGFGVGGLLHGVAAEEQFVFATEIIAGVLVVVDNGGPGAGGIFGAGEVCGDGL